MYALKDNPDNINGFYPYVIEQHGKPKYWLRLDGKLAGSGIQTYQAVNVSNTTRPVTFMKCTHWIVRDTDAVGLDKYCRTVPDAHILRPMNTPTTGEQYRKQADDLDRAGRDADAGVLRVLAQEADRLDVIAKTPAERFEERMDELDEAYQRDTRPCLEGKPSIKTTPETIEPTPVVVTKSGVQHMLPGHTPPPIMKGDDTKQLTMF